MWFHSIWGAEPNFGSSILAILLNEYVYVCLHEQLQGILGCIDVLTMKPKPRDQVRILHVSL